ncbi:arylamine N-acetyltransferase [Streptomyces sp. NPDC020742]|uniref:arylamine N-acetyltransferase family protein n=1 Tax=unclassified Streptomyces TaxID=2593676 RepID=UPI0033E7132D
MTVTATRPAGRPSAGQTAAYLERLGVAAALPSAAELAKLHAAHVARIPFETLDRPSGIDPLDALDRIVRERRGGVCYHLNGAFTLLLRELGYQVTVHAAGVQSGFNPQPVGPNGTHLVLTVGGLPSPGNPEGRWILDVGSGEGFVRPLPLRPGTYEQGAFTYTVRATRLGWRVDYDPRESCRGVDFGPGPADEAEFAAVFDRMADGEMSVFFRFGWVKRHRADGFDEIIGCRFSSVGPDGRTSRAIEAPEDYFTLLAEVFGMDLPTVSPARKQAMWERFRTNWAEDAFRNAFGVGRDRQDTATKTED